MHRAWQLIRESAIAWDQDQATRKGAALAFYTVFSLAPVLIIAIAIAGIFFGEDAARGEIVSQIRGLVGDDGARTVQAIIENAGAHKAGPLAGVAGFVTLIVGATTALAELKDGLDQIWGVPAQSASGLWYFMRKRLLSMGLILALAFLLLVSLVFSAMLTALARYWGPQDLTSLLLQGVNFLFSFGLTTALFALIYKLLPSVRIAWRDVLIGSVVTALLFSVGKYLIGVYLGNGAVTSSYGAAGSVVLILVWVYYSAQIFFLGAEFTKVYAHHFGSHANRPLRNTRVAAVLAEANKKAVASRE